MQPVRLRLQFDLAVLAGFCVQAGVCEAQALYRAAAEDVRFDDLIEVGLGDMSVPDGVGVDDDVGAVFALVEASGLIGTNFAFQSARGQFLFEDLLQPGFGGGIAASARMAGWALVSADEDVFFELGHRGVASGAMLADNNLQGSRAGFRAC